MSVHYKFKSSLDFDTISFDGLHISVADLKKEIINKKKLGKTQDFDLQITNAQTKEEYSEDSCLIPKNTSLIIARVPLATRLVKKAWDPTAEKVAASTSARERKNADAQAANIDLTLMNGTEEEKINAMMKQSTMDYDPRNYQKVRGSAQTGEVPSTYRCYKCNKMGHWIKNCPLNAHHDASHTEIKRSTGIPRSFIDAGNSPATEPINLPPIEKKQEIPDDLICSICKDLFTDAVMIPCCGSSFCDECVRTALLESEDNECPDCQEKGSSPGSLIPNRFLRNSVNSFKNETGYNKPRQPKKTAPPVEECVQPLSEEVAPKTPPITKAVSAEETSVIAEEEKSNTPETVETKEHEHEEAPRDCDTSRAGSPHDESDFEDNIIVTVPKPQSQNNYLDYRDRQNLNGRYNRSTNLNEVDQPSTNQPPSHQYVDKEHYGAEMKHMSEINMNMRYGMQQHHQQHPPMMQQPMPHRQGPPNQMQPNNFQPSAAGPNSWWNHPNRFGHSMHGMHQKDMKPIESNMQQHQQMNHMHHRSYGPIPHQPPQIQIRGYTPVQHHPLPQMHRPLMHQESNIVATAFQGVANKIGTGIIEDPLAAFEQIMKEKERRKIQRRAAIDSPPRRRSRSGERRRSPRHNSQDSRDRGRSTGKGERSSSRNRDRRSDKRGRSPDRRRSPIERRRRRSGSYHSRQSRSYSRSRSNTPPRRHSRSPPRKHSRSPQDRRSRSRSTSYSTNRNRYRRDYRDREEYRERSPNFYHGRGRGSYRGRGRGNYYRQDRNSMQQQQHHQHQPGGAQQNLNVPYYDQSMNLMNTGMASGQGGYNDGIYHDTQPNRYAPLPVHSPTNIHVGGGLQQNHEFASQIGHAVQEIHPVESNYSNEGNQSFSSNHSYDVLPPGVDREPPPPGFENEEQHAQHHLRPNLNRDSQSPTRSNVERERCERSDRKHHSKSPSSREQVRNKSGDGRGQYEKEDKKEINKGVNRTKDLDKKDLQREKERPVREKEKEREKDREKDDDKRERKSKDKKKKKKEEKSTEKKRKKDGKKDKKEKREKDGKKSSTKSHSHCSSGNEEKHMNSSEKEIMPNKASPDSQHETAFSHSTTPPPLLQQKNVLKSVVPVEEEANIDLYGDINIEIENEENNPNDDFGITNSPVSRLNRSDSILDIHTTVDFEDADLPKSESEAPHSKDIPPVDTFVTLPEPSKWERDEDLLAEKTADSLPVDDQTKVTNEVLKRAENAIFARAINAIRPSIEIKKICPERQKLYSNEVASEQDKSPATLSAGHVEKASDNLLQITVLNSEQERSVELKSGTRQPRNKTPIRSIKDRLGKKLNEEAKSKSRTPQRKIVTDNRSERARDGARDDRRHDRKYRSPKSSDNRRSSVTRRNDLQKSSEKSYRERERRRNSSEDRDTKENKDRKKSGRDGNEKDSSELECEREQHKHQVEKATRDTERDRELQKARVRARIREEERTKAQRDGSAADNSSTKEKKTSSSIGSTADRRKRFESNADSQNVGSMLEGNHHDIDESNFEPNYEAHPSDESPLKSKSSDRCTNRSKSKTKSENRKRSRSYSSSSSSSSDSNSSDSSSDSEERKKKRKRKHKKQKKSKKSKKKKKTKK
ncbi:E3 ubiquitin-protein ligase RBBP6 isoform X2 [Contarinia nasturtii]|uniref:E3 ubiquitin-protein ligase RBBP6 isoform X2 n=1 Tax=Contarinia nasturtii TaxID=265458 RepID=UPI0012D47BB5|nr:E3 ubiquitin-protein ligase RBBP6 isoform X2 [Contarinia nasturtii]